MGSSPNTPLHNHVEPNSIILFNLYEESFLLLKGEGRIKIMNGTAKAYRSFAVTKSNSKYNFFIGRIKESKYA